MSGSQRGRLYAGTSGFAFKEWKGVFYPEGVTDKKMLAYYSSVLGTVEVNYTFRRMPSESTMLGWKSQSSDGFKFTLKAPQRITHFKRLKDVKEDVDEFVRRGKLLGDRLGTILFQLPPNFKYDKERLEGFLRNLPKGVVYAMEFRHVSWMADEVKDRLTKSGVAFCGADTDEENLTEIPVTASMAYMRLRKEEYSTRTLSGWGRKIAAVLDSGTDVYCYLKHEGGGVGPKYALKIQEAAAGIS